MARSFAKVSTSIWDNPDFRALSPFAQRLYFQILSQKRLTLAGVVPYSPRSWARGCDSLHVDDIESEVAELARAGFVIVDYDTEELMVRTMLKHDPVKGSRTVAGLWNAWSEIDSDTIRRLVIHSIPAELWDTKDAEPPEAAKALRNTPSDTPTDGVSTCSSATENEKRAADGRWPMADGPMDNVQSSSDAIQQNPHRTSDDDDFAKAIEHIVDARCEGRDINDMRAYRAAVRRELIELEGPNIRSLLTVLSPENVAQDFISDQPRAEIHPVPWCSPGCATCDGTAFIDTGNGYAPCPERSAS